MRLAQGSNGLTMGLAIDLISGAAAFTWLPV